jgi:hypothetical protein
MNEGMEDGRIMGVATNVLRETEPLPVAFQSEHFKTGRTRSQKAGSYAAYAQAPQDGGDSKCDLADDRLARRVHVLASTVWVWQICALDARVLNSADVMALEGCGRSLRWPWEVHVY